MRPRGEFDILCSDSITDSTPGSRGLLQRQRELPEAGKGIPRAGGCITNDATSCAGICDPGPALLVKSLLGDIYAAD